MGEANARQNCSAGRRGFGGFGGIKKWRVLDSLGKSGGTSAYMQDASGGYMASPSETSTCGMAVWRWTDDGRVFRGIIVAGAPNCWGCVSRVRVLLPHPDPGQNGERGAARAGLVRVAPLSHEPSDQMSWPAGSEEHSDVGTERGGGRGGMFAREG